MHRKEPNVGAIILRYTLAFCNVERMSINEKVSLGLDLHFNTLAHTLSGRISMSTNTIWVLRNSNGIEVSIPMGKPAKTIVVTIKGIELCEEKSKTYLRGQ